MKLSITIVHNKTPEENEAQIQALLLLVERIDEQHTTDEGQAITTYHYQLKDLEFPHEVRFYQVIPFGVANPPSLYLLDSHKVFYGPEDAAKGETRFFNWGLKRGTDQGAEVSVYLEKPKDFDLEALAVYANSIVDPSDKHELGEDQAMKVVSLKLLREVGQLDESKPFGQAISHLKGRVSKGGLRAE